MLVLPVVPRRKDAAMESGDPIRNAVSITSEFVLR
jgi:hypothetical protein